MEKVHLFHFDGSGYITKVRGAVNPFLEKKASNRSKFCLVPLPTSNGQVSMNEGTRVPSDLKALFPVPGKVAIAYEEADGRRRYISCRRMCPATKSSLAEYRGTVTHFETFEVFFCPIFDAFAFKSHNGLYLHYNNTFATVAFKACRTGGPGKALWRVLNDGKEEHKAGQMGSRSGTNSIATNLLAKPPLLAVDMFFGMAVGVGLSDILQFPNQVAGFGRFVGRAMFGRGDDGGDGDEEMKILLQQVFDFLQTKLEELKVENNREEHKDFTRDVGEGVIESFSTCGNLPNKFILLGEAENWSHWDVLDLITTVNFMAGYVAGKGKNPDLTLLFAVLALGFAEPN